MHTPRPVTVHGLIIPADPQRRVTASGLALTSAALSDAIGGGLLDEALHATYAETNYVVYLDDERRLQGLPLNDRAAVLSARLGAIDRNWLADLRGDALFLGIDPQHNDIDVPAAVLREARAAGLMPTLQPTFLAPRRTGRWTRRTRP